MKMFFAPKEITLKDGRTAILRSPVAEDAQGLLDYLHQISAETDFVLRYPEECSQYTLEKEKEIIEWWSTSADEFTLTCFVDGKIAGNCNLHFDQKIKTRHRAQVAIALVKEFWGLGIGTKMFEEMIRVCEAREGVLQIELDFIEGNSRARGLYEKMGFRIVGVRPNAIRLKDGTLLNEYSMIREIKR